MSSTGTLTVVMICSAFFSPHFCEARALCVCVCVCVCVFSPSVIFLKIFFSLFFLSARTLDFFFHGGVVC